MDKDIGHFYPHELEWYRTDNEDNNPEMSSSQPYNPFLAAHFPYKRYDAEAASATYAFATGTLYNLRKFLQAQITLEDAEIVYCSSIIRVEAIDNEDSDDDEDSNSFVRMVNGNIKFNYRGSDKGFAELFAQYGIEYHG